MVTIDFYSLLYCISPLFHIWCPRLLRSGVVGRDEFDIERISRDFLSRNGDGESGAILSFIGVVRRSGHRRDKQVTKIMIEAHVEIANSILRNIAKEIKEKYNLSDAIIIHAFGLFDVGEPLVFVGLAKDHREGIFEAMAEAIRRYKTEPPLFKKEIYVDGVGEWVT